MERLISLLKRYGLVDELYDLEHLLGRVVDEITEEISVSEWPDGLQEQGFRHRNLLRDADHYMGLIDLVHSLEDENARQYP